MSKLISILLLLLPLFLFSQPLFSFPQNYDCESSFEWTKTTFEENDAGFNYVIEQKGNELYKQHNETYLLRAKKITNETECYELMRDWMTFFRKGHFGIRPLNQANSQLDNNTEAWETVEINVEEFKNQLKNKKNPDYEGIWKSGPYTIGIEKFDDVYKGFIIEANGSQWKKGQVKLEINPNQTSTYYMGNYSPETFEKAELLGDKYLQLGFITLERVFPESESNSKVERYYKAISAETPYLEKVNDNTLLLRIPSFVGSQKNDIDSVILANRKTINSTKNLIIDLRNNGGGSDNSFQELLLILYTNPIETIGVELYSTPRNNQRVKNFITHPHASDKFKEWATEAYKKLSQNEGKYVNLEATEITVTRFDTTYKYPENIGIIINEKNASTTEQFLLAAKQSTKVKLFGQTTFGALDISYTYPAKSPGGDFELIYCLSKSLRIPEMTIDNKGIQPDYFIYNNVPKYKWIDFVIEKLN